MWNPSNQKQSKSFILENKDNSTTEIGYSNKTNTQVERSIRKGVVQDICLSMPLLMFPFKKPSCKAINTICRGEAPP